ncbi:Hippocampus abundant transcript 1 protein [Acipenser ruthenus]|uniref:Hippocampus abundant transcript 1 protein n=1 Tax=Acipenser ruthenus TaxID=7906 RepID=A0A662YLC8_ACIRT|nr:Hippocampus abundant transcript 1 protein [Acipenser ruthenus]
MTGDKKKKKRLTRSNLLAKKIVIKDGGTPQGMGEPSVYHAVVVIFLEFFAWGLLTTPMLTVLRQTFPQHTFLMNGLIHGVKGLLSFLSAPLIGALSDVWGRKSFLLLTVFFTCAPIPLMQISPWWYFAVISMSGVFAVTFSVIFAYVADITQEHERSTAYGLVSATFAASLVTSPAIGAYLSHEYGDTVVVILATAIALLDICFILVAVPESLPEKMRPASWGAPISWEQADPFSSLRKVGQDSTVLLICITVFLSYLPEAGQYSCFFLYLRQVIGFTSDTVAAFIAVVGILSILAQTVVLGVLMRSIGNKNTILLGLGFQILQLAWYGFGSEPWMMWAAGALAAMSSITFPAISAIVSRNADPDQQGKTRCCAGRLPHVKVIGFTSDTVAAFIAVVGILSILAQTVVLGVLMRSIGNKNTILLGLGFQILQLAWYGFGSEPWMMWAAGALAAMSSITFPAISAIVSRNADPDQQGVVQGMVTGIRGLCNGLGPALYGFVFYLFHVELNKIDDGEDLDKAVNPNMVNPTDESSIIPGPPFLFGACSVLLSILVALFVPEHSGPNVRPGSYKRHSNGAQSHFHSPQPGFLDSKEPLLEDSNV